MYKPLLFRQVIALLTVLAFPPGAVTAQGEASVVAERDGDYEDLAADDLEPTNRDSLLLDLALVLKISADEHFIIDGPCDACSFVENLCIDDLCRKCPAAPKYCEAEKILELGIGNQLPIKKDTTRKLLQKEIEYRLLLLAKGLSFWGGMATLVPTAPTVHLGRLEALLDEFETLNSEIDAILARVEEDAKDLTRWEGLVTELKAKARSQTVTRNRLEVIAGEHTDRARSLRDQFLLLEQQRKNLVAYMESLSREVDQVAGAFEKNFVTAVAESVGVPAGSIEALQQGDLGAAVLTALSDDAVLDEIGGSLSQISSSAQGLNELYQQATQHYDKFEKGKKLLEEAGRVIRDPSLQGISKLGKAVYESDFLSTEDRAAIDQIVDEVGPVFAVADALTAGIPRNPSEACARQKGVVDALDVNLGDLGPQLAGLCTLVDMRDPDVCAPGFSNTVCQTLGLTNHQVCEELRSGIGQGCEAKEALSEYLGNLEVLAEGKLEEAQSLILAAASAWIDEAGSKVLEIYGSIFAELSRLRLDKSEFHIVNEHFARSYSHILYDRLLRVSDRQRGSLRKLFIEQLDLPSDASDDQIVAALSRLGTDRIPVAVVDGRRVRVLDVGQRGRQLGQSVLAEIDLSELWSIPDEAAAQQEVAVVKERLKAMLKDFVTRKGSLRGLVASLAGPDTAGTLLRRSLGEQIGLSGQLPTEGSENALTQEQKKLIAKAQKKTWKQLTNNRPALDAAGRNAVVGTLAAHTSYREKPELAPKRSEAIEPAPDPPPAVDPGSAVAEQAALMALNAAFPGAGVVVQLGQALATMNAAIHEMNRAADEERRTLKQMVAIQTMAREAELQNVLTMKEAEVAEIMRQAAVEQLEVYSFGIQQTVRNAELKRDRIRLRQPLSFYIAERMREEFDLFDRALNAWASGLDSKGSAFQRLVREDPRNIRYAVDSQIHLYDWLDRSIEPTRTSADQLMSHWRQLTRLAEDLCWRVGCAPGDGSLGEIQQTQPVSVRQLIGDSAWRRVEVWLQGTSPGELVVPLLLEPSVLGIADSHFNLRTIDLRVSVLTRDGAHQTPTGLGLRHPGIAFVSRLQRQPTLRRLFYQDATLPRTSFLFEDASVPFDLEALRTRWVRKHDYSRKPFEGYGLFSTWELILKTPARQLDIEDVQLRIAYFFQDASFVLTELEFLEEASHRKDGIRFSVPYSQWIPCDNTGRGELRCNARAQLSTTLVRMMGLSTPPTDERQECANRLGDSLPCFEVRQCARPRKDIEEDVFDLLFEEEIGDGRLPHVRELLALEERIKVRSADLVTALENEIRTQRPDLFNGGCQSW